MSLKASVRFAVEQAKHKLAYRILVGARNFKWARYVALEKAGKGDKAEQAYSLASEYDLHAIACRARANYERLMYANARAGQNIGFLQQAELAYRKEQAEISADHG